MDTPIGIPRLREGRFTAAVAAAFVVCWSSGFIGAKLGAGDAPVTTVLMWRFVPLAVLALPLAAGRAMRGSHLLPTGDRTRHVVVGLLSQSGYLLTVYWAIGLGVSTGTTALIDGVQPLVAAALVGPLLGVAVTGRQWIGLLLGLVGVALVSWTDATCAASEAPGWAYLVPFAGMLCLVASTILERRARVPTPPLHALAIHCTTSATVFTALALATGTATPPSSARFWIAMTWLMVLPTFGGYGLYWVLVERIGVTAVNGLMFLMPPVTAVWGAVMFGEPLTIVTVAGLTLALVAARVASGRRDPSPSGALADGFVQRDRGRGRRVQRLGVGGLRDRGDRVG
jgi:drug/metabolite transporter (DMT)-like permease